MGEVGILASKQTLLWLRVSLILGSSLRKLTLQDVLNSLMEGRLFMKVCLCRLTVFIKMQISVHLPPTSAIRL